MNLKKLIFVIKITILNLFFMYYFNMFLFKKLPSLFGMTQHELSDLCFGAKHKFIRRISSQETFLFQELVDLCNTLRISLADFITLNPNEPFLDNRYKYVIPENKFKPIVFQPKNIRFVYGPNGLGGNITRVDFAKTMGVSLTTITRWSNAEICSLNLPDMLRICNHYKINIDSFVIDDNKPLEQIEKKREASELPMRIWQELTEMKQIIEKEREDYRLLKKENEQLKITLKSGLYLGEQSNDYSASTQERKVRKWTVNWDLLQNLRSVLKVTDKEIIKVAGMTNYKYSSRDGDIPVTALVRICNKWQLSTRHFFLRNNGVQPPLYQYSYYRSEDWKTVVFHPENINDLFGSDALTDLKRPEIAELNGVSEASIRAWRKPESTMRLSDFIRLCNTLDVTPSCFITDNNRTELSYSMSYTEFLVEENRLLKQRILRMKGKLRKLKDEKESTDE